MVLRWFLVLKPLVPMVFNGFQMVANHRPGTEWNEPSLWSRPMLFRTPKTCPKMLKIYNIFMKYVCTLYLPALLLMPGANPSFCHKLERQYYFAQLFWDIKISKPPYVTFLKMVELCHFLSFSDLPERNYNSQSFWVTLYSGNACCVNFSAEQTLLS